MKSSLLTLTVISSFVLSGCFRSGSSEGCTSCSPDNLMEQPVEEMMVTEERETEPMVVGENMPVTAENVFETENEK